MTFSQRERVRARLVGLKAYYKERVMDQRTYTIEAQLARMPIGGVLPDERGTLIAHCGAWWPLEELPWTAPCCGWILREREISSVRV